MAGWWKLRKSSKWMLAGFAAIAGVMLFSSKARNAVSSVAVAMGAWRIDPRGNQYDSAFNVATVAYGLPNGLLRAMAWKESRFNRNAVSPANAKGLMQLMPKTAAYYGVDPFNPFSSIDAAGRELKMLYGITKNWQMALAAYNWGIGNLQRNGIAAAPAETKDYYKTISSAVGLA